MEWMPDWLGGVAAVLSIGFAVWSWWSSNASKKAKAAAEHASAEAERSLRAAEATADRIGKIADALEAEAARRPILEIERKGKAGFLLRNTSAAPVVIEEFANGDAILQFDLVAPLTLGPLEAVEFTAMAAWGYPLPPQLTMAVTGRPDHVHASIPD
jgi:hypothetical protein